MLIGVNWSWLVLMIIDDDWCCLILIDADWSYTHWYWVSLWSIFTVAWHRYEWLNLVNMSLRSMWQSLDEEDLYKHCKSAKLPWHHNIRLSFCLFVFPSLGLSVFLSFSLFSCPEQLNRWPCHSLTHWGLYYLAFF